jgi:hypothetical protein
MIDILLAVHVVEIDFRCVSFILNTLARLRDKTLVRQTAGSSCLDELFIKILVTLYHRFSLNFELTIALYEKHNQNFRGTPDSYPDPIL